MMAVEYRCAEDNDRLSTLLAHVSEGANKSW
jgi:hypothetical protein